MQKYIWHDVMRVYIDYEIEANSEEEAEEIFLERAHKNEEEIEKLIDGAILDYYDNWLEIDGEKQ